MEHLLSLSSFEHLRELEISNGRRLTVNTVNLIVQSCPQLRRLARLSKWGGVTKEQISTITKEARARNFDLKFDYYDDDDNQLMINVLSVMMG